MFQSSPTSEGSPLADRLGALHRRSIASPSAIRAILCAAQRAGVELRAGMDKHNRPRGGRILAVEADALELELHNLELTPGSPVGLSFTWDSCDFFFVASPIDGSQVLAQIPGVLYQAERREMPRHFGVKAADGAAQVELESGDGRLWLARVRDSSYQGLGVTVDDAGPIPGTRLRVRFMGNGAQPVSAFGRLRHRVAAADGTHLGLELSSVPFGDEIPVRRRGRILGDSPFLRARNGLSFAGAAARVIPTRIVRKLSGPNKQRIRLVDYENDLGQPITGIIDRNHNSSGGTAVIIPPAWGRTKETLLPLAETLLATFSSARKPLTVLRYDGTYRRGESFIPPSCRAEGREALQFTFSQGVRDIEAGLTFLEDSPGLRPDRTILVTFSLASIDGRRAVALNQARVQGWVCVVGMPDLQSGLRAVSGGIDYGYGLLRGVKFGAHQLGGVLVDMDNAGRDVLEHRLGFLEDARRDMSSICVPVTWIHGRHDGWIDVSRVQSVLSAGDVANRKLIEVPTGHQLRTSRQALQTFQLVASEVGAMALGTEVMPAIPDLVALERRSTSERKRVPRAVPDLRGFWRDYLLGSKGLVGIEMLTATAAYRAFMDEHVLALGLSSGDRVVDLGSGTGDFGLRLLERAVEVSAAELVQVDLVREALVRARSRLCKVAGTCGVRISYLTADLGSPVPLADESADAAVASLLVSYVPKPADFLEDARRILRPGGRLVVSTPVRDADISKVYMDGLEELSPERVRREFGEDVEVVFDELQREYLNRGAMLMDLEEAGAFHFWDAEELVEMVTRAGFCDVTATHGLGAPPQAVIVAARRR